MRIIFLVAWIMLLFISFLWADTGYVDPNGDGVVASYWYQYGEGTYYGNIDDAVRQPNIDSITSDFIYLDYDHWWGEVNLYMTTLTVGSVTEIKIWAYVETALAGDYVKTNISKDGSTWVGEQTLISGSGGPAWYSVTFDLSASPWSQTDLDGLQVKLKGYSNAEEPGDIVAVYAMYAEITYTPPSVTLKGVTLKGVTVK